MKPMRLPHKDKQIDLFRPELANIIDLNHGLVNLSKAVNWQRMNELFGATICTETSRPAISTRLMVSLHYLKHTFNLSDDDVVAGWVENPYWQYLSGMKFFVHEPPIHPSSMTRWRKRIGEAGAEELLKETIQAGLKLRVVKPTQLARANIDTTVQEKEIRFPTDARLYDRARQNLVKAAKARDIALRQNYNRKSKQLFAQQSRYAHARQMKRAKRCTRKMRTYPGRVIRDIERKHPEPDRDLQSLLTLSSRIFNQKRKDKNNVSARARPINVMSLAARSVLRPPAGAAALWELKPFTATPIMGTH
jgi:IS5 family transposase